MWLVNVYTPNSGEGLKRLDYRIQQWDKALAGYIKVRHTLMISFFLPTFHLSTHTGT